jgi:hypothetical protein
MSENNVWHFSILPSISLEITYCKLKPTNGWQFFCQVTVILNLSPETATDTFSYSCWLAAHNLWQHWVKLQVDIGRLILLLVDSRWGHKTCLSVPVMFKSVNFSRVTKINILFKGIERDLLVVQDVTKSLRWLRCVISMETYVDVLNRSTCSF